MALDPPPLEDASSRRTGALLMHYLIIFFALLEDCTQNLWGWQSCLESSRIMLRRHSVMRNA